MAHLGSPQRIEPQRRIAALQVAEQGFVEVDLQIGVQPALQQQLVAAQPESLLDLAVVLLAGSDEVLLRLVRLAVEVAEAAARNADVRDVDVAVDLPGDDLWVGNRFAPQPVGRGSQLEERRFVVEPPRLVGRQGGAVERLAIEFAELHRRFSRLSTNSKSSVRLRRSVCFTRMTSGSPSVKRRPVRWPQIS